MNTVLRGNFTVSNQTPLTACVSAGLSLEPRALRPRALCPLCGIPTCGGMSDRLLTVGALQAEFPAWEAAQGALANTGFL